MVQQRNQSVRPADDRQPREDDRRAQGPGFRRKGQGSTPDGDELVTAGQAEERAGADFTKDYHSDREDAHKDAVDLFKRYGDGGDNADLKAWAACTRPVLEHHLLQTASDLNK